MPEPRRPTQPKLSTDDREREQVFLAILQSADALTAAFADFLKAFELTPVQYNALRILRGAGDEGATCHDIAARLITRDPDVTRLLDRLEHKGLVVRQRDARDRRVVKATLTAEGLALVNQLDQPVRGWHADRFGHFSPAERQTLLALLTRATTQ